MTDTLQPVDERPETPGRRVDAVAADAGRYPFPRLAPGDYGKDLDGLWWCRPPWRHASGCLANHSVTENADGTVTVLPSIMIRCYPDGEAVTWHGFLKDGVWREC